MLPNNLPQLVGWILMVAAAAYTFLQSVRFGVQRWGEIEEYKSKERVEIAKVSSLSSAQVAEILKHYHQIKTDLETMKKNNEEKDGSFLKQLKDVEDLMDEMYDSFQQFLISMASHGDNDHHKHK